ERSEFELDPGWTEHRRLPRSAAQGSQTAGSPFLCLLSFGEQKKVSSRRATPGLLEVLLKIEQVKMQLGS
ncbi:MAG: hypothetical protein ABI660_03115, partial [Polaromonas sp.]